MRKTLAALFVVFAATPLFAQRIVQSSNGSSSLVLNDGGIMSINFADAAVELGYNNVVSELGWRWGAGVKAKASDGFAQLFGEDSKREGDGRLFITRMLEDSNSKTPKVPVSWLTLELTGTHATHSIASVTTTTASRRDTSFTGAVGTAYLDFDLSNFILPGSALAGVSAGWGRRHNYDADTLKKVSVCNVTSIGGTTAPATLVQKCKDAKVGPYAQANDWAGAFDYLWYPPFLGRRAGIDLMGRFDPTETAGTFSPGIGLFVTKNGSPLLILGGLTVEWKGVGKPVTGFQVGFPF